MVPSRENENVKKVWEIHAYCNKLKANITKGVCKTCEFKPTSKGLW